MPRQQLMLARAHQNHFLFADYYLDRVVTEREEWRSEDVRTIAEDLLRLWSGYSPDGDNEAQTEDSWVRPVLVVLGHKYLPQVPLATPMGTKTPDYFLFRSASDVQDAKALDRPMSEADLRSALAVADAKAWDRSLDQRLTERQKSRGVRTSENPSVQIDHYVRYSGLPWGILTNGRKWRLYHQDTSKNLDVYYEVDLPLILELLVNDPTSEQAHEALKYFILFFRYDAFAGDPSWLDSVLKESRVYEQGISESLRDQVYEALRELAQGFLDFPANRLTPTDEHLESIYDNSLIVLYRLLFTLYAEDRGLLPVRENRAYKRSYSLMALKRDIARDITMGEPAVASMDAIWSRLRRLWNLIDIGNPDLDVQAYNGGLFAPGQHPFLEHNSVGDRHLRRAIDLITRTDDSLTGKREFVDFRDLAIRHIGSIYEGLLEYRLGVAANPLVVVREKSREVYREATDEEIPTIPPGMAYLATDKGERKRTGSYYTPEFVVEFIVEHVVGPVLREAQDTHADDARKLGDAVLNINVLDPAMGSGHFLVAVNEYISRFLVTAGAEVPEGVGSESELAYWRRRVAQACVYGVDLNPLAVELAKLSLWLVTAAKDKPLSYLDHHLRCGNSLIGAHVSDILPDATPAERGTRTKNRQKAEAAKAAGQLSMLDVPRFAGQIRDAVRSLDDLEDIHGDTLEEVKEAEHLYQDTVRSLTDVWRKIADIETARYFGLAVDNAVLSALRVQAFGGSSFSLPQFESIVSQASHIAATNRFFHWELEFPEVFFDEHGLSSAESGFDAVVGNPPYISALELSDSLSEFEKPYWRKTFSSARGAYDIFILFMEQGLRLARPGALFGYITPSKYLAAPYASALREYLLSGHRLVSLLDLSHVDVFPEAAVYPLVTVIEAHRDPVEGPDLEVLVASTEQDYSTAAVSLSDVRSLGHDSWGAVLHPAFSLLQRIAISTVPLDKVAVVCASTTAAEADEFTAILTSQHTDTANQPANHPIINTGTIDRFSTTWGLKPLVHQGGSYERATINLGSAVVSQRRRDQYLSPKLIFAKVALRPEVFWDRTGGFASMNTNFVLLDTDSDVAEMPSLAALAAILNSKLIALLYKTMFGGLSMSGGYLQFQAPQISQLPIPRISFTTPHETRADLLARLRDLYQKQISHDSPETQAVLMQIDELLSSNPKRMDVVHDFLAFLTDKLTEFHGRLLSLQAAHDPFKALDGSIDFVAFSDAFSDELKYGELIRSPIDPSTTRHDIEGLKLERDGSLWVLRLLLKLRDPEDGWSSWLYEDDSTAVQRQWIPTYRMQIDSRKAQYYAHALPLLNQFKNARRLPGGKLRTVLKKLHLTSVPAFDRGANFDTLTELQAELGSTHQSVEYTDNLIDYAVYRLYDLSNREIEVVEGLAD